MIRHIAAGLGTLAVIGGAAAAIPVAARAAAGYIYIGGNIYHDSKGCYTSGIQWPVAVHNHTPENVYLRAGRSCTGGDIRTIDPGGNWHMTSGESLFVP